MYFSKESFILSISIVYQVLSIYPIYTIQKLIYLANFSHCTKEFENEHLL